VAEYSETRVSEKGRSVNGEVLGATPCYVWQRITRPVATTVGPLKCAFISRRRARNFMSALNKKL